MDPYFQSLFADRIGGANYGKGTEIYKFEKIKRAKRKALADFPNRPLIDFGIGENDGVAPESVRRKMADEINKPENRGYMDNGNTRFKEAAAAYTAMGPNRLPLYLYAHESGHVRARMFSPLSGTMEDAATGSAATPLAALLLSLGKEAEGRYEIVQGVEMGRPSRLLCTAKRSTDGIRATVGGGCVPVLKGEISL